MNELDRRFMLIMKKLLRVMKNDDNNNINKARNGNIRSSGAIKYREVQEEEDDGEYTKKEWIDEVEEIMMNLNVIKSAYDSIMNEIRDISDDTAQIEQPPPPTSSSSSSTSSTSSSVSDESSLTSGVEAIKKELMIRDKIIRSLKQDIESEVMIRMSVNDSDTNGDSHNNNKVNISNYEAMIETYCFVIETKPYIEE